MRTRAFDRSFAGRRMIMAGAAMAASLFLLAGCTPLWPAAIHAAAWFAGILILSSLAALSRDDLVRARVPAAPVQSPAGPDISTGGDGAMLAELSLCLASQAAVRAPSPGYLVFEDPAGPGPAAAADSVPVPAVEIRGDGFPAGPDFVRAANKEKMNPVEGDPAAIDRGGVLFNTRCGTYCHGGQAIGGGCPSLIDEFWIHGDSDLEIYKTIAGGGGPGTRMGAFGGELRAEQIWDIIAYLRHRGREYLMEKAGPRSFRQRGAECPNEIFLTLNMAGGATFQGLLRIEDKQSVTLEDRSQVLPTQYRVLKERILDGSVKCVD